MAKRVTESNIELGKVLAKARKASGLTQAAVAKVVRNQSWVSRVENGTCRPTPNDLDMLIKLYDPDRRLREIIEELRTPPPATGWQDSSLYPKFLELKRLELVASDIRVLTSERLPMQFQSDQYMLLQYHRAGLSISEAELFAERGSRQQVFTRDNPSPYHIVVTGSALCRMPRGRLDLIKEQASYVLACLDEFPGLHLRVLRLDADVPYVDADVVILGLTRKRSRVFVPFGATAHEVTELEASDCRAYWQMAWDAALGEDESRKFIHNLSENGYRPPV